MRFHSTGCAGTSFLVDKIAYPVPAGRFTLGLLWPLGYPHAMLVLGEKRSEILVKVRYFFPFLKKARKDVRKQEG